MLYGALYGGLYGSGPAGQVIGGGAGLYQGGRTMYDAGRDMDQNGVNACNALNAALGLAGTIVAARATTAGIQNLYLQYQAILTINTQQAQNPGATLPPIDPQTLRYGPKLR